MKMCQKLYFYKRCKAKRGVFISRICLIKLLGLFIIKSIHSKQDKQDKSSQQKGSIVFIDELLVLGLHIALNCIKEAPGHCDNCSLGEYCYNKNFHCIDLDTALPKGYSNIFFSNET